MGKDEKSRGTAPVISDILSRMYLSKLGLFIINLRSENKIMRYVNFLKSKSLRMVSQFILVITCTMLIGYGCGGGDDSSGVSYTGATSPATIDNGETAKTLAKESFDGGDTGGSLNLASSVQSGAGGAAKGQQLQRASKVIADAVRQVTIQEDSSVIVGNVITTNTESIPGSCGGSATFTASGNANNTISGSMSFNAYCEGDTEINGTVSFSLQYDPLTEEATSLTLSFSAVTSTSSTESITLSGTMAIDISSTTNSVSMSMSMLIQDGTGKVYQVQGYTLAMTEGISDTSLTVSGTFFHPDHGSVTVSTEQEFVVNNTDDYPSSGILLVTGDTGIAGGATKARLVTVDSTSYYVEADTNGDGTYDYNSGNLPWSEV